MTITDSIPAVVPDFDAEPGGRKLAIICSKGSLDMAYPGLVLANAALGEGVETHLFFTFWGFELINKQTMGSLQFTALTNSSVLMSPGPEGQPQLSAADATAQLRESIAGVGAPEVPDFLDQIVDSGGRLWACRMSADMNRLAVADLYDGVEGIISASDFIEKTAGAQVIFI
jgi:peroxiredoxin family protein